MGAAAIIREGKLATVGSTTVAGRLGVSLDGPAADLYPAQVRALADQQGGRNKANLARQQQAAAEHATWQAWVDEMPHPRPSDAEIIARIAQRAGRAKRTVREWFRQSQKTA